MGLKLYATPLSHFARKIRILLQELEVPFELEYVENLLSSDPVDFGGNPILRIPTLVDGDYWVVESDQIAGHIVERFDPQDRFGVLQMDVAQRNALSMINAAMGAEVEILLSQRSGIVGIRGYDYFRRYYVVIDRCLDWLEKEGARIWPQQDCSYLDIALACMWDHLAHYRTTPKLDQCRWLAQRVASLRDRPAFLETAPVAAQA
ncbi:MAG: glutathione S-transferase family protein [Planctomycetota bacterium]